MLMTTWNNIYSVFLAFLSTYVLEVNVRYEFLSSHRFRSSWSLCFFFMFARTKTESIERTKTWQILMHAWCKRIVMSMYGDCFYILTIFLLSVWFLWKIPNHWKCNPFWPFSFCIHIAVPSVLMSTNRMNNVAAKFLALCIPNAPCT